MEERGQREIYDGLTDIARDVFDDPNLVLHPATCAADVDGWDSLNNINFLVAVEVRFGVRLLSSDIEQIRSVGELAGLIRAQINS